jgi:hypothetical protein
MYLSQAMKQNKEALLMLAQGQCKSLKMHIQHYNVVLEECAADSSTSPNEQSKKLKDALIQQRVLVNNTMYNLQQVLGYLYAIPE